MQRRYDRLLAHLRGHLKAYTLIDLAMLPILIVWLFWSAGDGKGSQINAVAFSIAGGVLVGFNYLLFVAAWTSPPVAKEES